MSVRSAHWTPALPDARVKRTACSVPARVERVPSLRRCTLAHDHTFRWVLGRATATCDVSARRTTPSSEQHAAAARSMNGTHGGFSSLRRMPRVRAVGDPPAAALATDQLVVARVKTWSSSTPGRRERSRTEQIGRGSTAKRHFLTSSSKNPIHVCRAKEGASAPSMPGGRASSSSMARRINGCPLSSCSEGIQVPAVR